MGHPCSSQAGGGGLSTAAVSFLPPRLKAFVKGSLRGVHSGLYLPLGKCCTPTPSQLQSSEEREHQNCLQGTWASLTDPAPLPTAFISLTTTTRQGLSQACVCLCSLCFPFTLFLSTWSANISAIKPDPSVPFPCLGVEERTGPPRDSCVLLSP